MTGAGRQRQVEVVAAPVPDPDLVEAAAVHRIAAVLVQRHRQYRRVGVERVLGAVAVVDVPVDDRDPPDAAVGLGVVHGDRDVAEHAEAAPATGLGMVTAGSDQGVGVVDPAVEHRVDRRDAAAGGEAGDLEAARAEAGAFPRIAAVAGAQLPDPRDVVDGVEPPQFGLGRRARPDRPQPVQHAGGGEQAVQPPLGLRSVVRRIRLGERVLRSTPGIVPGEGLVPDESGGHHSPPGSARHGRRAAIGRTMLRAGPERETRNCHYRSVCAIAAS